MKGKSDAIEINNNIKEYMTELYQLFAGTDISILSDWVIVELLEQDGHTLVDYTTQRNTTDYAVSFCVNDYDTAIGIDYDSNVSVSEIIEYTEEHVTIASFNGESFTIDVIDLND